MNRYEFLTYYVPERMMGGIENYVHLGLRPGDFLTAVISNDLASACGRADSENLANLPAFVAYFYNLTPHACWGSVNKMEDWIKMKRNKQV